MSASQETGPTSVRRSVEVDAAPEDVWRAISDESLLRDWLAPDVEIDLREGGELTCRYEDGEERRGTVELVEEAERLAFRWHRDGGACRVEFTVDAVAGRCRLTVVETRLTSTQLLGATWEPRLASLRSLLGTLAYA